MAQVKAMCKGVGKYKDKFNTTGLLLDAGKGEFWADIKGKLNYRDYKNKEVEVDITKNAKGYWGGTVVGQTRESSPSGTDDKDRLIVAQVVYKALSERDEVTEDKLSLDVDMIMRIGSNTPRQDPQPVPAPECADVPPGQQDDDLPF